MHICQFGDLQNMNKVLPVPQTTITNRETKYYEIYADKYCNSNRKTKFKRDKDK